MKEMDGFVKTYSVTRPYNIDIQMVNIDEPDEAYEAWLYHPDVGVKMFMFAMPTSQQNYDEFIAIVEDAWSSYVGDYERMVAT